jgi:chemotaxis protein methyltransferase CheR
MNNIIVHKSNEITKLFIQSLSEEEDIDELLNILNKDTKYEITLYNIKVLPYKVLIKLSTIKNNIKIIVNELKIRYYLKLLGFYIIYSGKNTISRTNKFANIEYVGLGGSAGSIEKILNILTKLPPSSLTFFIVIHQQSSKHSNLSTIFQNATKHYNVLEAKSNMKIEPSCIYVAPPSYHMIVAGDYLFFNR